MNTLKFKQGESSNVLNLKVSIGGTVLTDLNGYVCKYIIRDSVGIIAQAELAVAEATGIFPLRLTPTQTNLLAVGYYSLCAEISNATTEFNRESEVALEVTGQCLI